MKTSLRYAALTAALAAAAVLMTWPLARVTDVAVPSSDDAYFSIWRLAWVAHALPADPGRLVRAWNNKVYEWFRANVDRGQETKAAP